MIIKPTKHKNLWECQNEQPELYILKKLKISDVSIPLQKLEKGQKTKSKDNRKKNNKDNSRINKI